MPDFSKRSNEIEIMDDLNASGPIIHTTLRELETINHLLGGNHVTIDAVQSILKDHHSNRELIIADLGCGSGDILKLVRKKLNKKNIKAKLIGIDANPHIVEYAKKHSTPEDDITFESVNIFSEEFQSRQFDIVTGTLFFHHFDDVSLTAFFKKLKAQTRIGFVINDIHRHWFAYYSIRWLTAAFSKSSMVKNDAAVSVMRAFKRNEIEAILQNAGISNYSIKWMWAFRWQVIVDLRK